MKIGLFALSSPLSRGSRSYSFLQNKGIEVYEHPNCTLSVENYLAGSVLERLQSLYELYRDPSVDVVMSFWGGFNSNQLLRHLDFDLIRDHYKPTIGFSDTSALLLSIWKQTGKITYMGPAGITFLKPEPVEFSFDYFNQVVLQKINSIDLQESPVFADDAYYLKPAPANTVREQHAHAGRKIYRHGTSKGILIASNIQTLAVLCGTPYFPNLSDSILFLEEDESSTPQILLRFLTQLKSQSNFENIKGVVFGLFPAQTGITSANLEYIFSDIFGDMDIPIIYDASFGHIDPIWTLPIGGSVHIDTKENLIRVSQQ